MKAKNGKSQWKNYARQNNAAESAGAKPPDEEESGKVNLIRGDGMASESNS